jgi:hypothetical protein
MHASNQSFMFQTYIKVPLCPSGTLISGDIKTNQESSQPFPKEIID